LRSCEKERKTDGVKSIPKSPENVAPFTIGGWPVGALSQGMMRLLRKIAARRTNSLFRTATLLALEMNLLSLRGAGAGEPSQSDLSARSILYFFPLRMAADPQRFLP